MDEDDAIPPPIRRSPRAALERRTPVKSALVVDDDFDEAAPMVPRSRSASMNSTSSRQNNAARFNPLAAHPISTPKGTEVSLDEDAQSTMQNWESLKPFKFAPPAPVVPVPHRSPARLKSYRTNKRLPLHLRRRTSLETIKSVATTHSISSDEDEDEEEDEDEDGPYPAEASDPSPYSFTLTGDGHTDPVPPDAHSFVSSKLSSSASSKQSNGPPSTPITSVDEESHSPALTKTIFRKILRKQAGPSPATDRLVIERMVSVDQISHQSSHSSSKSSRPSDRPDASGLSHAERSRSGTSSEWSASEFDASSLTEVELKKCKKKGINPALFAEMKAARKGKWTSPIAGNTFL